MIDAVIVGIAVAGAVAYLAWTLVPRRRAARTLASCGACARSSGPTPAAPVRTRWTG
jgi:uncharacterized membrane protein YccC